MSTTSEALASKKKPTGCAYCGNNPVNHRFMWTVQTLSVLFVPIAQVITYFDLPMFRTATRMVFTPYLAFFRMLGFLRLSRDIHRAGTERSFVIWTEANARGIPMEQFVIMGKPVEQYRAMIGGGWKYFDSLPIPSRLAADSYAWMDDKSLLKKRLLGAKVPVPQGGRATSYRDALAIFNRVEKPVIVKPAMGSRGRHSLTMIRTEEDLRRAFEIAKQICHFVVVEEHLVGSVYRGTYIGGKIVGILRGDPPRIMGDGTSTIERLIAKKNEMRHEKVKEYKITMLTHEFLKKQELTLDTVLPKGKTIDLSEKIGLSYGGYSAEEIPITHPKIIEYLRMAGDALRAPVVGFDFIIPDITKDPDVQKWGVIEANSLPFINLHHFPLEGEPVNAAAFVWDLWKN